MGSLTSHNPILLQGLKLKVNLRSTVSRPVSLGAGLPSGAQDQIFVLWATFTVFLIVYSYNCFWSLPEQSLSGPSPAELTTMLYCLIRDSPNLEGYVMLYRRALSSLFVASYDSQGYVTGVAFYTAYNRLLYV
jgi:hypothetical protein